MKDRYLQQEESYYRLKTEYEKHGSLVIAYDFDNTVFDFHSVEDTYPLMIELLQNLKSINCYLICFTSKEDIESVKDYLLENGIPFDGINENPPFFKSASPKIYYNALLDDRAGLIQTYNELKLLYEYTQLSYVRAL